MKLTETQRSIIEDMFRDGLPAPLHQQLPSNVIDGLLRKGLVQETYETGLRAFTLTEDGKLAAQKKAIAEIHAAFARIEKLEGDLARVRSLREVLK